MNSFKTFFCLLLVTLLASVSWSKTQSLRISCVNQKQIGHGKIEISGGVELSVSRTNEHSFQKSFMFVCDEKGAHNCPGFQAIETTSGSYQFDGRNHFVNLSGTNVITKETLTLKLIVPSKIETEEIQNKINLSDSFTNHTAGIQSELICQPQELSDDDTLRATLKMIYPGNWFDFFVY